MAYKFYLQKASASYTPVGEPIDIEAAYNGLKYRSISGLETKGAVKNIYTESYADSDTLRVWHPSDIDSPVLHEATEVTLSVVVLGTGARDVLDSFRKLLYSGRLLWWDTARHRKACLILQDEQTVTNDTIKGLRYIAQEFRFTNVWGTTKPCEDDGTITE